MRYIDHLIFYTDMNIRYGNFIGFFYLLKVDSNHNNTNNYSIRCLFTFSSEF